MFNNDFDVLTLEKDSALDELFNHPNSFVCDHSKSLQQSEEKSEQTKYERRHIAAIEVLDALRDVGSALQSGTNYPETIEIFASTVSRVIRDDDEEGKADSDCKNQN